MTLKELKAAVRLFFGDTSRPASETREGLCELSDDIDMLIYSIPEEEEGD
jgi:hypothetical protein